MAQRKHSELPQSAKPFQVMARPAFQLCLGRARSPQTLPISLQFRHSPPETLPKRNWKVRRRRLWWLRMISRGGNSLTSSFPTSLKCLKACCYPSSVAYHINPCSPDAREDNTTPPMDVKWISIHIRSHPIQLQIQAISSLPVALVWKPIA